MIRRSQGIITVGVYNIPRNTWFPSQPRALEVVIEIDTFDSRDFVNAWGNFSSPQGSRGLRDKKTHIFQFGYMASVSFYLRNYFYRLESIFFSLQKIQSQTHASSCSGLGKATPILGLLPPDTPAWLSIIHLGWKHLVSY